MTPSRDVLVTGATGYMGTRVIPTLVARGHRVRALTREASRGRVPAGAEPIVGNALDAASIATALRPEDTLLHLVGTAHPSPAKAKAFVDVDLQSVRAAVEAARATGVSHIVYVSVAQPAPVMRAFLEVRAEGERLIRESGVAATILRPWYVLGPGHRWPYVLCRFTRSCAWCPGFATVPNAWAWSRFDRCSRRWSTPSSRHHGRARYACSPCRTSAPARGHCLERFAIHSP